MACGRVLGKYMILCSNESNTVVPSVVVIFCCINSSIVVPMLSLLVSPLAIYFALNGFWLLARITPLGLQSVPTVDDLDHQLWGRLSTHRHRSREEMFCFLRSHISQLEQCCPSPIDFHRSNGLPLLESCLTISATASSILLFQTTLTLVANIKL